MNNGRLEQRWFKEAALITSLADILHKVKDEERDVSEDSDSNDEYDSGSKDSNADQTVSF